MFPTISPKQSFPALEKFDEWNEEKKKIQEKDTHEVYINPRDIWYVKMGINIGNETNGKGEFVRPVLVLKRVGNLIFVAPLTTKGKDSNFYHILSTVKYLDTQYSRDMSRVELWDIKKKLIKLLL